MDNQDETINFDFFCETQIIFKEGGLIHHSTKHHFIPTPILIIGLTQTTDKLFPYEDISSVKMLRHKEVKYLIVGILLSFLSAFFIYYSIANSDSFSFSTTLNFSIGSFLLFGLFPLYLFFTGKKYLVIASEKEMVCLPAAKKKDKIDKILQLLQPRLPESTTWSMAANLPENTVLSFK